MDDLSTKTPYRSISVKKCSPHVGAEIGNIDLTRPLNDLELSELKRAFTDHGVLFFRNQKISFDDHARLGE
jgi:taurine dioxygenase